MLVNTGWKIIRQSFRISTILPLKDFNKVWEVITHNR